MNSFTFLFDLPAYQAHRTPQRVAGGMWRQGIKEEISSEQLADLVNRIAVQFIKENIKKGDRVVLLTDRYSIKWLATDMAIMAAGAISCPLHHPVKKDELDIILQRLQPVVIIHTSSVEFEDASGSKNMLLDDLVSGNVVVEQNDLNQLKEIRSEILPDDIATIVHTSGSSGEPRAVCLSHNNVVSNVMSVLSIVPFVPGTRVMSFLPLSHIFERIVCYVYLACGANIYFLETYRNALWALKDIRPEYFTSVPLILERFVSILEDRIEETSWFTRWAYRSWEKTDRGILSHLGSLIAHQWIIKRWKRSMGGKLKGIVSGAAYLDPKVERLYDRSGIKIRQGYGLTEASPVIAINRFEPGGYLRGTVGLPIPGVHVKIAEDGEVLVQGPNVMIGYYKDEEATRIAVQDGWLHTGDIGRWEREDFLVITDRKSNIYKHASGKFIAPAQIESILDHHPLIHQAMIIGFQRPYTIALIIPHFDGLKKVCAERNIHWTAPEYMIHNTLVIELYRDVLDHLGLQSHERIEKFILLADTWSPENGLLTATYKPRRKEIMQKYAREMDEVYEK
ncbi:MAG: long-chain fatty acid--CoA ligase [Saprospiraceae bacterium]|nr:long-chain fatty acid--CoA ligase [Saprospiraceae bacterium]